MPRHKRAAVPLDHIDRHAGPAFGLADDLGAFTSEWHCHRHHQLLYAARGAMQLETADGRWLLPPQRMAWIRGGTEHRVTAAGPVELRTVYMAPALTPGPGGACVVMEVPPLAREMLAEAMRWGPDQDSRGAVPRAFFAALAALAGEWASAPASFSLPGARTPELARAMEHALAHLDSAGLSAVAHVAHVSEKTLARRFESECRMTWRQWLHRARMLTAMERLAAPGASATRVALDVGFASQAAFTRAFTAFTGESPGAYKKRGS